ncbi:MAG: hypothetical protein JOY76_11040 [Hyphomicrobiales bacterium]|nr:hypothetical protein [Hyphomicrobiales bacterium]
MRRPGGDFPLAFRLGVDPGIWLFDHPDKYLSWSMVAPFSAAIARLAQAVGAAMHRQARLVAPLLDLLAEPLIV